MKMKLEPKELTIKEHLELLEDCVNIVGNFDDYTKFRMLQSIDELKRILEN